MTDVKFNHTKFVQLLLQSVTISHWYHLRTKSYAKHVALEEFYTELRDLTDKFAEASQAVYGDLREETMVGLKFDSDSPISNLKELMRLVRDERTRIEHPGLINIVDDVLTLILQTLYKLENLT